MTGDDEWAGILDPDERILWQGRPDGGFAWERRMMYPTVFGAAFAGFAAFWTVGVAYSGGGFWPLGFLFIIIGLWLIIHTLLQPSFVRRRTWYTLTNKRAFIAANLPVVGRRLQSYPLNRGMRLENPGSPLPNVIFASAETDEMGDREIVPIGFERIADAPKVLQLMQGLRKDDL